MFRKPLNSLLAALLLTTISSGLLAQVAQEPLLNRNNTVSPNLVLILDNSGSMDDDYIYQYGATKVDANGLNGPGGTYAKNSPDVNRIYYDPRVRYMPRIDYLGTPLNLTLLKNPTWTMYLRKTPGPYTSGGTLVTDYYTSSDKMPAAILAPGATLLPYPTTTPMTTGKNPKPTGQDYPKFIDRKDCVTPSADKAVTCTYAEESRNYSIWYQWYSNRIDMVKTSLGAAFQPLVDDTIRLGYGKISQLGGSKPTLSAGISSYNSVANGVKSNFYDWLYALSTSGSTPNLTAVDNVGKYYERTDSDGPWATLPDPTSTGISTVTPAGPGKSELPSKHASCRRSFSMLITDGYYNDPTPPTTAGDADEKAFTIPPAVGQPFVYTPAPPYAGKDSNTLADMAMYYWGRDLRSDLANRVRPIDAKGIKNPSTWQNVSFYAVTLGIDGTLAHNATTLAGLSSSTSSNIAWPKPVQNDPTTVDDTWHATINGRGDLLNARSSNELTAGLAKMFDTIVGDPQTLSGVSVSTTFLKAGSRKYKPQYISGKWSGRLSALELDATTGNDKIPINEYWQVESGPDAKGDPISKIPAAAGRSIYTWNGSSAVPFDTSAGTGLSADLISYLRGDASKELRNGGTFRDRDARLGDIINSSPAFIQGNVDLSYEMLLPKGSFGDYRTFVTNKNSRAGVLYVGANDGMFHGFRDADGVEMFAFVPKAVVPNLSKLSVTPYVHQYYVDGPNKETDAFLDNTWKNIILSTTGAGARSVFAIDVSNPATMNASKVLWEIDSTNAGFSNLGYVLSDVQAGLLPNGDWVAIFGNGYGSSGGASLFVVNLKTGTLLKELVANPTSGSGLGGVALVRDATQRVIGAYAGDLKGNMWKFDLSGASSGDWKVGLSGALFAAGANQPITAAPAVLPHPKGGYVVTFGTGKFFELSDTNSPFVTQSLYGIWDAQPFGAVSTPTGASVTSISSLVEQTISTVKVTVGGVPVDYFAVSTNAVAWGDGLTGIRGWYINLKNSGQRTVYPIQPLTGTFVIASTLSPVSAVEADACVQTGSGSGWAYLIDGVTGSGPTQQVLSVKDPGADPLILSGWQDPVDGRPTPISINTTAKEDDFCIETAQTTCTPIKIQCGQAGAKACPIESNGNGSITSREWRQLFMR